MSEENLAVVQHLFPLNREIDGREIAEHPDFVRKLFEPLVTDDFSVAFVAPGLTATFHGAAGMAEGMREYMDAFLDLRTTFERHIDGEDAVVALGRQYGRTHHGVEFNSESGAAFFFAPDGKLRRIQGYQRWSEALEAAGLSE